MLSLFLLLAPLALAASSITPEMEAHLQKGLDGIYTMDFDMTEREADAVITLSPEHPHGHFGKAAASMMRYVYDTEQGDQRLVAEFEARMQAAADKAAAWLARHPDDAEVTMLYGATFGVRSRLQVVRKQWLKAYLSARKAIRYQRAALELDPSVHDAWLGIGMYDYYTDVYPSIIGVLSKIMLRGDRRRGVSELRLASEKGRFSNVVADLLLVEIALEDPYDLRDPEEAVRLMAKVRKRYPGSAMLHAAEISALYEARRWPEALESAEDYLRRVDAGKYKPNQRPKARAMLGHALWRLGRREEALAAFAQAASEPDKRYGVWSMIRQAQLLDVSGRREAAVLLYKRVADLPDTWHLRRYAEAGLRRAFSGEPRSLSPLDSDQP